MNSQQDYDRIRALEEELLKPSVRGSPEAVGQLLADGFTEISRSGGMYGRDEVIRSLASESGGTEHSPVISDSKLITLADGVVLLTYRSRRLDGDGKELHTLRSSIWKLAEEGWQMVFHQGTPSKPAPDA